MQHSSKPAKTEDLYTLAVEHGHAVDFFPLSGLSLALEDEGKCYIAMRPDLSPTEEKEALAHELGHCEYGGFYSRYTAVDSIQRHERKAERWAMVRLLPLPWVLRCIERGICTPWEIAEEAGVSSPYAEKCLCYYHEIGMI